METNSNTDVVDNDWDHLYPDFRERLHSLFAACAAKGLLLKMAEGMRSQRRQARLYAQGRPGEPGYRPGPIVTDNRVSKWHGAGLAADCYPERVGQIVFEFTNAELQIFRGCMKAFGLRPTTFSGDFGHVQRDIGEGEREKAMAWAQSGFAEPAPALLPVPVVVNGSEVVSAGGCLGADGHARAWVRPVADALGASIENVSAASLTLARNGATAEVPVEVVEGRAFAQVTALALLAGVAVAWDSKAQRLVIKAN